MKTCRKCKTRIKEKFEFRNNITYKFEINDYFITTLFIHEGFENEIFSEIKTSDKTSDKMSDKTSDKMSDKTSDKMSDKMSDKTSDKIINFLKQNGYITTLIASELLGLSTQRARAVLGKMAKDEIIIAEGANKNRKYKLKNLGSK